MEFIERVRRDARRQLQKLALEGDAGNHLVCRRKDPAGAARVDAETQFIWIVERSHSTVN